MVKNAFVNEAFVSLILKSNESERQRETETATERGERQRERVCTSSIVLGERVKTSNSFDIWPCLYYYRGHISLGVCRRAPKKVLDSKIGAIGCAVCISPNDQHDQQHDNIPLNFT